MLKLEFTVFFVRVSAPIDGGQCCRREELAKSVVKALLERVCGLFWMHGQPASGRVVRRALLVDH